VNLGVTESSEMQTMVDMSCNEGQQKGVRTNK